jgi:prevent-host-death family protein
LTEIRFELLQTINKMDVESKAKRSDMVFISFQSHAPSVSTQEIQRLSQEMWNWPSRPGKLASNLANEVIQVHTVGVFEAKNKLTALLDEVEEGGEVLITRRGKPVARLVRAEPGFDRTKARRAADGLRTASKGQTLGGVPLKELISEGRR